MTKVTLYIATSIDGYIARKNGALDWLPQPEVEGEDYGYNDLLSSIDAIAMGSATYEQILSFGDWPYEGKQSYIFTQRELTSTRNDIHFVSETADKFMRNISSQAVKKLWLLGGAALIADFMKYHLIDEYIITIIPVLLGEGISLFQQGVPETTLKFSTIKSYADGICELHYEKP